MEGILESPNKGNVSMCKQNVYMSLLSSVIHMHGYIAGNSSVFVEYCRIYRRIDQHSIAT